VAVTADLLAEHALFGLRAAQGVLGRADRHSDARLELAYAKAIGVGAPSYRPSKRPGAKQQLKAQGDAG
jgi:hypothetical protein